MGGGREASRNATDAQRGTESVRHLYDATVECFAVLNGPRGRIYNDPTVVRCGPLCDCRRWRIPPVSTWLTDTRTTELPSGSRTGAHGGVGTRRSKGHPGPASVAGVASEVPHGAGGSPGSVPASMAGSRKALGASINVTEGGQASRHPGRWFRLRVTTTSKLRTHWTSEEAGAAFAR